MLQKDFDPAINKVRQCNCVVINFTTFDSGTHVRTMVLEKNVFIILKFVPGNESVFREGYT